MNMVDVERGPIVFIGMMGSMKVVVVGRHFLQVEGGVHFRLVEEGVHFLQVDEDVRFHLVEVEVFRYFLKQKQMRRLQMQRRRGY